MQKASSETQFMHFRTHGRQGERQDDLAEISNMCQTGCVSDTLAHSEATRWILATVTCNI